MVSSKAFLYLRVNIIGRAWLSFVPPNPTLPNSIGRYWGQKLCQNAYKMLESTYLKVLRPSAVTLLLSSCFHFSLLARFSEYLQLI